MVVRNQNKIRHINLGKLPVERVFLNGKIVFQTPPYILVYTESTENTKVIFSILFDGESKNQEYEKTITAKDSPARIDFTRDSGSETIKEIRIKSGYYYKIVFDNFDLSAITKVSQMFNGTIYESSLFPKYTNPSKHIREIILRNIHLPDGISLESFISGLEALEIIDFSSVYVNNPSNLRNCIYNCKKLNTAILSGIKGDIRNLDMYYMFYKCPELSYIDISGITTGFDITIDNFNDGDLYYNYLKTVFIPNVNQFFYECPKLDKIKLKFAFAYHIIMALTGAVGPSFTVLFIPQSWTQEFLELLDGNPIYSAFKNFSHFEIPDLDDYKEILEEYYG